MKAWIKHIIHFCTWLYVTRLKNACPCTFEDKSFFKRFTTDSRKWKNNSYLNLFLYVLDIRYINIDDKPELTNY